MINITDYFILLSCILHISKILLLATTIFIKILRHVCFILQVAVRINWHIPNDDREFVINGSQWLPAESVQLSWYFVALVRSTQYTQTNMNGCVEVCRW